jgi:hypothetical protein
MASKYAKTFVVPTDFPNLIHDFAREVLKDQPENIYEFGAAYFKAMEEVIVKVNSTGSSFLRKSI